MFLLASLQQSIMIHRYLFLFILFPCLAQAAREVVLLDTREARDSLNWYKISVNGNFNDGWGELSFEAKTFPSLILPTSSSTLWRTQYVCDITAERRVDNWLRSPYLKRQQAQRIEIELGFSIRDCATFQTPNEIRSCRETFELYIHENDTEDNSQQWSSYKLIDIIAGNRFTSNNYGSQYSTNRNNLTVNVKTRGISVQKNGFYIAFRDQGACISLLYVKIYYRLCEDRLIGLVQFPETSIGSSLTDIVERYGICSINSQLKHRPIGFCKGNGEWTFEETSLHDSCHCQQGYELLIENHLNNQYSRAVCKLCPMGTYKSTVSNHQFCQTCPLNSYTKDKGAIVCHCNDGFFRLNSSMFDSPCIGNPNEPENVTIDKIDQASVRISWKQIDDRIYHLECHPSIPCESYFIYQPNRTFINSSNVKIIGLKENTNYRMKLFTEQISTHLLSKSIDLSFTTKRSISQQIRQISIDRLTFNTILLSWSSENFDSYELLYWSLVNENKKILLILSINNFTLTTTSDMYKFQIRGHNRFGWTSYSDEKLISLRSMSIDQSISSNFNTKNVFLISGPMFILGLMLIVLIATIICYRKRTCRLKNASDCESLDYQKRQVLGHYGPDAFFNSNWTAPLWPSLAVTAKTYIDPHTYEDPTKAVQEFAHELDPNLIVIESVIGGGEFGEVCRGKLHQMNTSKEISVAIKTLKQGASEKTRLDFLSEASIMGQFNDDNVIYLEGVVTKHHPIMIVTEYMENGSLDTYLRTNEGNSCLDVLQLTRMLKGIASGMKYLSEMKYVHRDLAARNILVNKDLICKVADFGLSREIDQGDSYTTKGGKIPIRWTAIEAIDYRKFTSASDVWSFGVLCWEVISFGERPYWNWSNQDVIKAIKNAYRLPPPMNCPDVLYKLMIACWNEKYLERPKFIDIVQQLTHLIQSPNRLGSLAKERSFFVNHPDQPNLAQLTSISHWLENLQLDHLISFFHNQNYTNLSQICHFNLKNFNNLLSNYVSLNEKTRLLENLNQLRSQLILIPFKSEGYLV